MNSGPNKRVFELVAIMARVAQRLTGEARDGYLHDLRDSMLVEGLRSGATPEAAADFADGFKQLVIDCNQLLDSRKQGGPAAIERTRQRFARSPYRAFG
jgi:hypothetical protein